MDRNTAPAATPAFFFARRSQRETGFPWGIDFDFREAFADRSWEAS
jgi:hypothetical protein